MRDAVIRLSIYAKNYIFIFTPFKKLYTKEDVLEKASQHENDFSNTGQTN